MASFDIMLFPLEPIVVHLEGEIRCEADAQPIPGYEVILISENSRPGRWRVEGI